MKHRRWFVPTLFIVTALGFFVSISVNTVDEVDSEEFSEESKEAVDEVDSGEMVEELEPEDIYDPELFEEEEIEEPVVVNTGVVVGAPTVSRGLIRERHIGYRGGYLPGYRGRYHGGLSGYHGGLHGYRGRRR